MPDDKQTNHIVIAGGGSAGWMAATFLSNALDLPNRSDLKITLVESAEVPSIGVGEATVHTMREFLQSCGVIEGEFMNACDVTLKHGILFQDWMDGPISENDHYFHPFGGVVQLAGEPVGDLWLAAKEFGVTDERFDRFMGVQSVLAAGSRSPKGFQDPPYEAQAPYGYHLDANKFAHYLKAVATKRGVCHVVSHINDVCLDNDGAVSHLKLKDGEELRGTFYLDCTGFARVLHSKVGGKFISYEDRLFVDRAVSARTAFDRSSHAPRPYTTAKARTAGWTFDIDLSSRHGRGYVYSSKHISDEDATAEFRASFPDIPDDTPLNHISMAVGRVDKPWIKNCLALGLSSGFLEPLESTGLMLTDLYLRFFLDYADFEGAAPTKTKRYNDTVSELFDFTTDFIVLHYILTKRDDTQFWRDVRDKTNISERLQSFVDLWRTKTPTAADFFHGAAPFPELSYACVCLGMEHMPDSHIHGVYPISRSHVETVWEQMKDIHRRALNAHPTHADFLQKSVSAFD